MTTSRREFLLSAGLAAAGLSVLPAMSRAELPPVAGGAGRQTGLLFGAADLPRMRKALAHPHAAPYWKSIVEADLGVDLKFLRENVRFNNHSKDMLQVRQILERTSFVFAITGDARQGDVARMAVDKLLAYPKWDYFLDGGEHVIGLQRAPEATIAMALAREWLDPVLSRETVTEMEKQIAEKGAPACYRTLYGLKYPERVRGWGFDPEDDYAYRFDLRRWPLILNSTNLKVIPIAGLGLAGCLLHGRHPEADRWIDLAVQSAQAFAVMFGPDGSYDEGVGYWGYTALHLTMLVEVVHRILGMDLSSLINFQGTVRYGLQMSMPVAGRQNDCVNFGDAWSMGDVSVAAWTARRFKDPLAQYVAANVGELKSHFSVIWLDPVRPARKPGRDLLDVRLANDLVISRSGWGEADGLVALRSGGPANHEHADRNSLIFKAYGERLFHDPYKAAYSYTDPHWVLRLTESHTAVLIDGKGHQYHDGHEGTNASWAEAHIVEYRKSPGSMVATSDATEAYRLAIPGVTRVQRTVVFLKPDILIILDIVRLNTTGGIVQVRFQVDNSDGKGSVAAEETSFIIARPLASVKAVAAATGRVIIKTGTLNVPADKGIHPYAEISTESSPAHAVVTLCTAQKTGADHGNLRATLQGEVWTIRGAHNGKTCAVTIDTGGNLPHVSIL